MKNLENLIFSLANKIPYYKIINLEISAASVGWHIEHVLLTINVVVNALQNPQKEFKIKFSIMKNIFFAFNRIPRGKAKSPKLVTPQGKITFDSINNQLFSTKKNIELLNTLDKDLFFEHPYFGYLKVNSTRIFLEIHTKHHLKIIDDILNNYLKSKNNNPQ